MLGRAVAMRYNAELVKNDVMEGAVGGGGGVVPPMFWGARIIMRFL